MNINVTVNYTDPQQLPKFTYHYSGRIDTIEYGVARVHGLLHTYGILNGDRYSEFVKQLSDKLLSVDNTLTITSLTPI